MKCPKCGRDLEQEVRDDFVEDDRQTKVTDFKRCECGKKWSRVHNEELGLEQLIRQ